MNVVEAVRQANRPGAPEHSVLLRVAATGAVVTSIVACWAAGELSATVAWLSIVLVILGNAFSYRRRARPVRFLKPALALAVVIAFVWFFLTVSARASTGDLGSVEGPLAVLFTIIQVTHAFDVPCRRDLGFSLAGSATLMAVAAAQSIDDVFGLYVVVWGGFGLVGLLSMWGSQSGGSRIRPVAAVDHRAVRAGGGRARGRRTARPPHRLQLHPALVHRRRPAPQPGGLAGGRWSQGQRAGPRRRAAGTNRDRRLPRLRRPPRHRRSGEPRHPGRLPGARRPTNLLDRRDLRPLDGPVVGHHPAAGQALTLAATRHTVPLPRAHPGGRGGPGNRRLPDLLPGPVGAQPHLPRGQRRRGVVPRPAPLPEPLRHTALGHLVGAGVGLHRALGGEHRHPGRARGARAGHRAWASLSPPEQARFLQLPHPYPRVAALARRITAHAPTTYAKILALEDWMGTHTRYTLDIPPLSPGQDTVEQFLFGSRRGYCEQISTSLAVMLRTLGIPAREATGYVPGPYDPLTDLYDVQAQDAHAWVQVWFPGYGWQSFDPTAVVPLANPSTASVLTHDLRDALGQGPGGPGGGRRGRRRPGRVRRPATAAAPRHLGGVHHRRAGGDGQARRPGGRARGDPHDAGRPHRRPVAPTRRAAGPRRPQAGRFGRARRLRRRCARPAHPARAAPRRPTAAPRGAAAAEEVPGPGGRGVSPGGGTAPRRSSPRQPAAAGSPSAGGGG